MVIPHPTELPPANLYLEELQKINRILLKHSQSVSFMIDENDAGYAFASLDDMLSEPPSTTPRQMSIHAYPISISIHISSKYIWISYDSNDAVILGIVEQIRQIFRQNTSWFQKWRYSLGYVYITTLLIATICRFSLFPSTNLLLDFIYLAMISIGTSSLLSHLLYVIPFKTIRLTPRKPFHLLDKLAEDPATIIGSIAGAIVSAILSFILSLLFIGSK